MPLETTGGVSTTLKNNLQSVAAMVLLRRFAPNDDGDDDDKDDDAGVDIQAGDTRHERNEVYDGALATARREVNGRAQQATSGDLFFVAAPRSVSLVLTPPLFIIASSRLSVPSSPSAFRCLALA